MLIRCYTRWREKELAQHFVASATARTAAALCGVNRKTAAYYFHGLREIVALELEAEGEALFDSEIEVDESYFGGNRKGSFWAIFKGIRVAI